MKQLLILIFVCFAAGKVAGQDIFQKKLYSADLIMAHQGEIELTNEQSKKIRQIYDVNSDKFKAKKWELYDQLRAMSEILDAPVVNIEEAKKLLEKTLILENEIKMIKFEALVAMKNKLTASQQQILDQYTDQNEISFDSEISLGDDDNIVLKVKEEADKNESPLYILKSGKGEMHVKSDAIRNINPEDIKSIEVLKGESATDA